MTLPAFASETAIRRFRLIQPHIEDDVPLARIAEGEEVCERTLRRWVQRYHAEGIAGLERRSRSDRGQRRRISPELEKIVQALALRKPSPATTTIHRRVLAGAEEKGLPPPSYAVVSDIIRHIDPAVLSLAVEGKTAYRNQYDLVKRREASVPNGMWQADHTLLDILILDERGKEQRPWLTVIVDDYSRAVCGYFLSPEAPSAMNTALALHQAIWRKEHPAWPVCGIPEVLYVDNGSDFTSAHIEQACIRLKIRLVHSRPGQPRGRGRIERLFRTINDLFLADLPGHLVAGKPVSEPTLDMKELTASFETFLHEIYHRRPHGGTGVPPIERWQVMLFSRYCRKAGRRLICCSFGSRGCAKYCATASGFNRNATLPPLWPPLSESLSRYSMIREKRPQFISTMKGSSSAGRSVMSGSVVAWISVKQAKACGMRGNALLKEPRPE